MPAACINQAPWRLPEEESLERLAAEQIGSSSIPTLPQPLMHKIRRIEDKGVTVYDLEEKRCIQNSKNSYSSI